MKICSKCHVSKALDDFYTSRGKRYPSCKACHNAHQRAYRQANAEKVREQVRKNYIKRTYGITPEVWETLLRIQGGVCAICEEREPVWVDHDHRTGLVRGLLCKPCNWGLGQFRDDPAVLNRALMYTRYYELIRLDDLHREVGVIRDHLVTSNGHH